MPETSGFDAAPVDQVKLTQGLSFEFPLVDVNIVCPSPIEPDKVNRACESPFANVCCIKECAIPNWFLMILNKKR